MAIKDIIKNNRTLFENVGYLSLLQIFSILFPLITYSYLIRVLGAETYGLVIFAQSITAFFVILINFGFNFSAVKSISINRDNKAKLNEIVSSILIIKVVLFIVSFLILFLLIAFIPSFYKNWSLYILSMGICISEMLFPTWYFQGLEKMKYVTITNVIIKGSFTILIVLFINHQEQYLLVPLINGVGALLGSMVALWFVFKQDKIIFYSPKIKVIKYYIVESLPFFFSKVAAAVSAYTNRIVIGYFVGYTELSFLDLAEKLVTLLKMPNSIINTAIYPRLSQTKDKKLAKRVLNIRIGIGSLLTILLVILAKPLTIIISGYDLIDAVPIVRIFSVMIIITAFTYYTGDTLLNAFGHSKEFNLSVIYSSSLYAVLLVFLFYFNNINLYSVLIVLIITEIILAIYRQYFCIKYKIL